MVYIVNNIHYNRDQLLTELYTIERGWEDTSITRFLRESFLTGLFWAVIAPLFGYDDSYRITFAGREAFLLSVAPQLTADEILVSAFTRALLNFNRYSSQRILLDDRRFAPAPAPSWSFAPSYPTWTPTPRVRRVVPNPGPLHSRSMAMPTYGHGVPPPTHGMGVPPPTHGMGVPAYGRGVPPPTHGMGVPAYGTGVPPPTHGMDVPAYGTGVPPPTHGAGSMESRSMASRREDRYARPLTPPNIRGAGSMESRSMSAGIVLGGRQPPSMGVPPPTHGFRG